MVRVLVPIALVLTVALSALLFREAHADVVPGEYSLEVQATPEEAPLGWEFLFTLGIHHSEPPYQAAQWRVYYDPALIQPAGFTRHFSAPLNCFPVAYYSGYVAAHCIDVTGPTLTYSGIAIDLFAKCISPGVATLQMSDTNGATALTFVKVGTTQLPVHTHSDSVTCTGDVDSDGDGCVDTGENGADNRLGGERDSNDKWDFFDVTFDHAIDLSDVLDILQYFGLSAGDVATNRRDRFVPDMAFPWRTAEANDGVDLTDALVNLQSYGADCAGA